MSLTIEFIQGCLVVSCRCGERLVHWHSLFSNSDGSFPAIPGIEHLAPAVLSECQKCHASQCYGNARDNKGRGLGCWWEERLVVDLQESSQSRD